MDINLYKAAPLGGKFAEDTTIHIIEEIPSCNSLEEAGQVYQEQAERLFSALRDSLPMGTKARLLILLLEAQAGYYRGI